MHALLACMPFACVQLLQGTLLGASGRNEGFWLAGLAFGPVFPRLMARSSVRADLSFPWAEAFQSLGTTCRDFTSASSIATPFNT